MIGTFEDGIACIGGGGVSICVKICDLANVSLLVALV